MTQNRAYSISCVYGLTRTLVYITYKYILVLGLSTRNPGILGRVLEVSSNFRAGTRNFLTFEFSSS